MFTEITEFGHKVKEEIKAKQRKIYREPSVKGRNRDSNEQAGAEGRNKQSTRTE